MKHKFLVVLVTITPINAVAGIVFHKIGEIPPVTAMIENRFAPYPQNVVRGLWSGMTVSGKINDYRNYYTSASGGSTYQRFCSSGSVLDQKQGSTITINAAPVEFGSFNTPAKPENYTLTVKISGHTIPNSGISSLTVSNPSDISICFESRLRELAIVNSAARIYMSASQTISTTRPDGGPGGYSIGPSTRYLYREGSLPAALAVSPRNITLQTNDGKYSAKAAVDMRGGRGTLTFRSSDYVSINGSGPTKDLTQSIRSWSNRDVLRGDMLVEGTVPVGQTSIALNLVRQYD